MTLQSAARALACFACFLPASFAGLLFTGDLGRYGVWPPLYFGIEAFWLGLLAYGLWRREFPGLRRFLLGVGLLLGALPACHWCVQMSAKYESPSSGVASIGLFILAFYLPYVFVSLGFDSLGAPINFGTESDPLSVSHFTTTKSGDTAVVLRSGVGIDERGRFVDVRDLK